MNSQLVVATRQQDNPGTAIVAIQQIFPAIFSETRSHVGTACAAYWMYRKPQTLRAWACLENGPIRPTRVNGRLAWSVAEIRGILAGSVK